VLLRCATAARGLMNLTACGVLVFRTRMCVRLSVCWSVRGSFATLIYAGTGGGALPWAPWGAQVTLLCICRCPKISGPVDATRAASWYGTLLQASVAGGGARRVCVCVYLLCARAALRLLCVQSRGRAWARGARRAAWRAAQPATNGLTVGC
jgi:hypothetical protein